MTAKKANNSEVPPKTSSKTNDDSNENLKNKEILDLLSKIQISTQDSEGNEQIIQFSPEELQNIFTEKIEKYRAETLRSIIPIRFNQNVKNLGINPKDWKRAVLQNTSLFVQSPETINSNIEESARLLGLQKQQYVEAALKQPQLFYQSPETINSNIEESARLLGLQKQQYVEAALKQPQLFSQSPETIGIKYRLYLMFIQEKEEEIRNKILRNPIYLSYAPERLMAHYIIAKLKGQTSLTIENCKNNPDTFARKHLSSKDYEIYQIIYNYLRPLSEKRRKIKRKMSGVQKEVETTNRHAQFVLEYFGKNNEILTPEQREKIENLVNSIQRHQNKDNS
ncbi:MAG: hypothetical protein ACP5QN_01245 [Minisyncoccia bacterium]